MIFNKSGRVKLVLTWYMIFNKSGSVKLVLT